MAMSMRSRGGVAGGSRSRRGVRPVYEDFKPMSEWKHEDGNDILLYQLPGNGFSFLFLFKHDDQVWYAW